MTFCSAVEISHWEIVNSNFKYKFNSVSLFNGIHENHLSWGSQCKDLQQRSIISREGWMEDSELICAGWETSDAATRSRCSDHKRAFLCLTRFLTLSASACICLGAQTLYLFIFWFRFRYHISNGPNRDDPIIPHAFSRKEIQPFSTFQFPDRLKDLRSLFKKSYTSAILSLTPTVRPHPL